MRYHVTIDGVSHEVTIDGDRVALDGQQVDASLEPIPGSRSRALRMEGAAQPVWAGRDGPTRWILHLAGVRLEAEVLDERTRVIQAMGGSTSVHKAEHLRAPMPGLVVKVMVSEGERVASGQGLVIVEAMKMENELAATMDAHVVSVPVSPGDAVEKGQVLVELESLNTETGSEP
jgi:pyruvate carboxylase subunit B